MKIAVIGSGISGLGCAWILDQKHEVTLYEKEKTAGGHSRTLEVSPESEPIAVDTGFIVYNYPNYPNLKRMFEYLDVPIAKSNMSFGVSIAKQDGETSKSEGDAWLEYSTQSLAQIFAQKRNYFRPKFIRMIRDILRFNKNAHKYAERDPSFTLGDLLDELKMGDWFRNYYLLAMGGAIWSCPLEQMLKFPASSFIRFFANHGLLSRDTLLQWYTVVGGSREYVSRIARALKSAVQLQRKVVRIDRVSDGVSVTDALGETRIYDQVVIAAHADQALRMLSNPTANETEVLSAFRYQPNRVVLHRDISFMPENRETWASWVYRSQSTNCGASAVSLTYWMNNLQPLKTDVPILVTLNPTEMPDSDLIYDSWETDHPIFDEAAIRAQGRIAEIQGVDRIWYCGAYQRNGFHEDGLASAVKVAEKIGVNPPWHEADSESDLEESQIQPIPAKPIFAGKGVDSESKVARGKAA